MSEEAVKWLREMVTARLTTAQEAISNGAGAWHTGCECGQECHDYPPCERVEGDDITIYNEGGHDSGQARHIALNDPQDVIARCEAELGILDLCAAAIAAGAVPDGATWSDDAAGAEVGTEVLRLLASGYKHREGYAEHWGEVNPRARPGVSTP